MIKKNLPIIIIGLASVAILIGIVFASQKQAPTTSLEEVDIAELIAEHSPTLGTKEASVILIEFSDFQCPFCKSAHTVIDSLVKQYPDDIFFVYRHFPLSQHRYARKAAEASQAAHAQGKFWEYHDMLFENQENIDDKTITSFAQTVGLDMEKFASDLENGNMAKQVTEDISTANKLNVSSTPTLYLNGKKLELRSLGDLQTAVEQEILKAKENLDQVEMTEKLTPQQIDERYGVYEIDYTKEGFSPNEGNVLLGQIVKWTNSTESAINIVQTTQKFDELAGGIELAPEESFEFRLTKDKLWTFEEEESKNRGSIFIQTAPEKEEQTP